MMTSEQERGFALMALMYLNADHSHAYKIPQLKAWFPPSVIEDIKAETVNAREFNKEAEAADHGLLTPEGSTYWEEVKLLLRRAATVASKGRDPLRDVELNKLSERLEETFDSRVNAQDRPKFVVFDAQDDSTWDPRYEHIQYRPGLLKPEFESFDRILSPANHAQRVVLTVLVEPPFDDAASETLRANGLKLRSLAKDKRDAKILKEIERDHIAGMDPQSRAEWKKMRLLGDPKTGHVIKPVRPGPAVLDEFEMPLPKKKTRKYVRPANREAGK